MTASHDKKLVTLSKLVKDRVWRFLVAEKPISFEGPSPKDRTRLGRCQAIIFLESLIVVERFTLTLVLTSTDYLFFVPAHHPPTAATLRRQFWFRIRDLRQSVGFFLLHT